MKTVTTHPRRVGLLCLALALSPTLDALPQAATPGNTGTPRATCLPGERGYLRASLRGEIDADLDWRGALLQCEGGARPDGRGLRVSFLGP
ncbi:MAG: hypothetical protein JSR15_10420, partial [Proteobacteria bacterium]|nr:hypothetical protein [Pseudomonadota bacterium]